MAQGYDSDVQLSVGLSLEDVISQSKKLSSTVSKLLQDVDTSKLDKGSKKLIDSMTKAETEVKNLESDVESLTEKIEKANDYKLDVKVVDDAIDEYTTKLMEAFEARKKLADQKVSINDPQWKAVNAEIKELTRNLNYYKERKDQLSEHPIVADEEEARLESVINKWEELNDKRRMSVESFQQIQRESGNTSSSIISQFGQVGATFSELGTAVKGIAGGFSKVSLAITAVKTAIDTVVGAVKKVIDIFKKLLTTALNTMTTIAQTTQSITDKFLRLAGLGPVIDSIKNKVGGLFSRFKSASNATDNFGQVLKNGVKKLFAYGLGIASLTALFSKMRSAISSGIQAMAKMNNGMNQTNTMMTQLTSSLNLLKGALATAFVPILTTVSPILSSFMQQLANVITFIGMMIAKLTGAKSYMKATFKSTDYASSSGGGGSKGKTAQQKYDEAVKKAQKKYDKKVSETEAKNAERMAKAEEKQAKAADKLAKKQEKANNKLAAFDDLNVLGVDTLEELEDIEADLLEMPELELPNLEDFTGGGGGGKDPFGLEEVPLDDFEWNWDDLLKKARELGEKLAEFLNDIFADKDLAKKIGNTIGNLINMAINFAYGFVSKFKFRQFGEWLGTLIQEAIETIDWGLLGETIGKGLNGIADTIIGFFDGYEVGTLGASIAEMLNRAVAEVDPEKLGEAFADTLKAPLIEMATFLTDSDWKEVATKLSEFIKKVFESDELNGETLGQSVGNFVQSIIDTINEFFSGWETGTLGSSIAKYISDVIGQLNPSDFAEATYNAVNMIAGEIKAFFEGLPVEELATKIATWVNESVKGVDTDEVAESIKSMLKTAFTFIANLFNNTDFEEIGKQIGTIISNVFSTEEGDNDLADAASDMIAAVVNAGLKLLDGLEDSGAIDALKDWIWEVITQAIDKIDTEWIGHKISQKLIEGFAHLTAASNNPILNFIFGTDTYKEIEDMGMAIDDLNFKVEHGKITADEYKQQYYELTGIMPEVTGSLYNLDGQIQGIANSFDTGKQKTQEFAQATQETAPQVKEAWEGTQEPLDTFNEKLDVTGFKLDTDLPSHVDGAKQYIIGAFGEVGTATEELETKGQTHVGGLETTFEELAITVDGTTQTIRNNTAGIDEAANTSKDNVNSYSDSAVQAIGNIQSKFGEVALDFAGFTESIQTTLDTFTTMIDTWYQEIMLNYFGYDAWLVLLQEGMLLAFTDFFTTFFFVMWDTQMQLWWDEHVLKWFKNDWWNEQVYTPWETFRNQKWSDLMKWWDSMMKSWWDTKVVVWFKESKWEEQFNNVYKVAQKVGEKTRDKIKELATETEEAVHEACNHMKEWIQEIIEMLHEAIELAEELASVGSGGGGGGSSSGGSGGNGGYSNGGGGGSGGFLPAINIMHFEDNLGMSAFKFPELATGAVIPPNNKFLAVLGDQKSGMNIETPLATMVEAFRSVMDEYMNPSMRNATMEVDGETFARLMMPHMMDEMNRLGYNTEIIEGM